MSHFFSDEYRYCKYKVHNVLPQFSIRYADSRTPYWRKFGNERCLEHHLKKNV